MCLKKLNMKLPYDPTISTSGYLSEENENTNSKRYMNPMFIAALLQQPRNGNNICVHGQMNG